MKLLLAIISCERDRHCHDVIRDTYLPSVAVIDHRFFLAGKEDDGYHSTYKKNHAIMQWVVDNDYDFVFTCDVDTYIVVPRLLACGFEQHDYMGHRCDEGHAGGGYGYWLSRRAVEILHADPPDGTAAYNDLGIGMKLRDHGILCHDDPGFGNGTITVHLGDSANHTYDPQWMRDYHERHHI